MSDHNPDTVPLQAYSDYRTSAPNPSVVISKTGKSQPGDEVDFQLSDFSVVCGRGRDSFNHIGNRRFRILASMFIERYSRADTKAAKTVIVSEIIEVIHQADGNFCKKSKGKWVAVEDHNAREKVSALLRDLLHTEYRSSAKAKIARRKTAKAEIRKKKKKKQNQQAGQKLVDDTPNPDDSPTSSSAEIVKEKTQNQQAGQKLVADTPHSDEKLVDDTPHSDDSSASSSTAVGEEKTLNQQADQELVDDTPHSDDSSTSSTMMWKEKKQNKQSFQNLADDTPDSDDSSTSSTCWGSTKDSLGYEYWLEDDFFETDVF